MTTLLSFKMMKENQSDGERKDALESHEERNLQACPPKWIEQEQVGTAKTTIDGEQPEMEAGDDQPKRNISRELKNSKLPGCYRAGSVGGDHSGEGHFEIQWANLSLQMENSWFYKLSNIFSPNGRDNHGGRNLILDSVDGRIKSGELTAILGPSGAGKTSLLNSLFGEYRTLVTGSIKVSGAQSKKHLNVCTIPQQDHLMEHLTTEESLWFASRLKNTDNQFDHDKNIERVLALLGLETCRSTRINKLSGGQRKRVSIAQEMLSSPDVLVLDEPTSGLDSFTCLKTIKVLHDLVEESKGNNQHGPMAIIMIVHQPQVEVLALIHSIYVMAVGGQTLFQGSPKELSQIISKQTHMDIPSASFNVASAIVEIASGHYGREPIKLLVAGQRKLFKAKSTKHSASGSSSINRDIDSRIMTSRRSRNSGVFWRHVYLTLRRSLLSNMRDPLFCITRLGAHIILPVMYALVFGSEVGEPNGCPTTRPEVNLIEYATTDDYDIFENIRAVTTSQFSNLSLILLMFWGFTLSVVAFTALSFPLTMHILIKEIRNGWYTLAAFFVGKWLAELPMTIILPPISFAIIQLTTGQPSSYLQWRYMGQSLVLILMIMLGEAKGLIFGPIFMNSIAACVFIASLSTVPFILVSGFFIRIRKMHNIVQPFARISYFTHALDAIIINRYGFGLCPCDPSLIPENGIPRIVGIPDSFISLADYHFSSYVNSNVTSSWTTTMADPQVAGSQSRGYLFDKLAKHISLGDALGYNIQKCSDVQSLIMKDMELKDEMLGPAILYLVLFILLFRFLGYFFVGRCIRMKL